LFEHPTVAELALEIEIMQAQEVQMPSKKIQRVSRSERSVKRSVLDQDQKS
jgi:hypothetical protein